MPAFAAYEIAGGTRRTVMRFCSATIIVSSASAWIALYHDRKLVRLEVWDFDAWLDGSVGSEVLKPAAEAALLEWEVSPRLNRTGVGDDDLTIIERQI